MALSSILHNQIFCCGHFSNVICFERNSLQSQVNLSCANIIKHNCFHHIIPGDIKHSCLNPIPNLPISYILHPTSHFLCPTSYVLHHTPYVFRRPMSLFQQTVSFSLLFFLLYPLYYVLCPRCKKDSAHFYVGFRFMLILIFMLL